MYLNQKLNIYQCGETEKNGSQLILGPGEVKMYLELVYWREEIGKERRDAPKWYSLKWDFFRSRPAPGTEKI